jgi:hypothetical protein
MTFQEDGKKKKKKLCKRETRETNLTIHISTGGHDLQKDNHLSSKNSSLKSGKNSLTDFH